MIKGQLPISSVCFITLVCNFVCFFVQAYTYVTLRTRPSADTPKISKMILIGPGLADQPPPSTLVPPLMLPWEQHQVSRQLP